MNIESAILFFILCPSLALAQVCKSPEPIDADVYHQEVGARKVTFIAVDLNSQDCWVIDKAGLTQRHVPFSSFKIPHTLMALETEAVDSVHKSVEWDPEVYPALSYWPSTWQQPQTLVSAFQRSAVWYYQDLTTRIEAEQYQRWLARFQYGNQKFTPGNNQFWLDGELKISPLEQVEFLVCLLTTGCGVKPSTLAAFESLALQKVGEKTLLYAKTGAGPVDPNDTSGAFEGWYVGYIKDQQGAPVAAFTMFVEAENFASLQSFRHDFSLQLLADLGFLAL